MTVDSHCHLTIRFETYELPAVFSRASGAGVRGILLVGYDPGHFDSVEQILDTYGTGGGNIPALAGTIGIHPHEADKHSPDIVNDFQGKLDREDIVAIGETGLDFFRDYADRTRQEELFRAQVRLSSETGFPLVIHSRNAYDPTIAVLNEFDLPDPPGVFHCYGYGVGELENVLEMGFYVSLAGNLTYPRAIELHQVGKRIPDDRFLVETDTPFLIPQKAKNRKVRRNEPALVMEILDKMAELKGISQDALSKKVVSNTLSCFPGLKGIKSWAGLVAGMEEKP